MLATSATLYLESFLGAICELPLQLFFAFSQKLMMKKVGAVCFFNNSFLKISGVKLLDFK
ncbi:hypothetical protein D9V87_05270 [Bacteroidetes/Chlorobi group bacterium MS-B_bin-24]|jgi:hypothetical protein|nr:MAG: hypothetical protein D9V87_05270 [Bacteroidetes/Chlorobi group bacterium MS-B_bin-24]